MGFCNITGILECQIVPGISECYFSILNAPEILEYLKCYWISEMSGHKNIKMLLGFWNIGMLLKC